MCICRGRACGLTIEQFGNSADPSTRNRSRFFQRAPEIWERLHSLSRSSCWFPFFPWHHRATFRVVGSPSVSRAGYLMPGHRKARIHTNRARCPLHPRRDPEPASRKPSLVSVCPAPGTRGLNGYVGASGGRSGEHCKHQPTGEEPSALRVRFCKGNQPYVITYTV